MMADGYSTNRAWSARMELVKTDHVSVAH
jgi:hypothetical protein